MNDVWGPPRLVSTVISRNEERCVFDKVVMTDRKLRYYYFPKHIRVGKHEKRTRRKNNSENIRKTEYVERSIYRARNTICLLAENNFDYKSKFLTLTFRDTKKFDIKSIKECDKKFRIFIKKLRSEYPNIIYLMVREFQERGAVHYHILITLPYVYNDYLAEMWGHGIIFIEPVTDVFGMGVYLSKYLSKAFGDKRFKGCKTYIGSNNLKKPQTFYGSEAKHLVKELINKGVKPCYQNSFGQYFNREIAFSEYNLTHPIQFQTEEEKLNEIRSIFEKV